jgi:hypothetical protein
LLPNGEALDTEGVDEFLRWRPATLVTIIGDRDSGKTTLICSIYDRLLRGPFAGFLFAGSRTLVGLERRSHYARATCGMIRPDTARTSMQEGRRFIHFGLARAGDVENRHDLLICDRAGEAYRQARSNSLLVRDLIEVVKANHLVILLDGARLSDPFERSGVIQIVRQTVRALIDGGALGRAVPVQVVTTKIDLLAEHPERTSINERLKTFEERLRSDFGSQLGDLTFWQIAARADTHTYEPAAGVAELVCTWLAEPLRSYSPTRISNLRLQSEFDQLVLRTPTEVIP